MGNTSPLDEILPEYDKISQAPEFGDFEEKYPDSEKLERAMKDEALKRYKAMDWRERVYLVQNPALMCFQVWRGAKSVTRLEPQFVGTVDEIKKKGPINVEAKAMAWGGEH